MNVAGVSLKLVNVNVVTIHKCPFCNCDPCDCDWGLDELFKKGNLVASESLAEESSSGSYYPTIEDLRLPAFDSIYNTLGTGGTSSYKQRYKGTIVDLSIYKVGDLVNWYPLYGFCDFNKVWLIKEVFSSNPLDCSYYDYEITDGLQCHHVTFSELKKLEDK